MVMDWSGLRAPALGAPPCENTLFTEQIKNIRVRINPTLPGIRDTIFNKLKYE
jgi:hypothetical protein